MMILFLLIICKMLNAVLKICSAALNIVKFIMKHLHKMKSTRNVTLSAKRKVFPFTLIFELFHPAKGR